MWSDIQAGQWSIQIRLTKLCLSNPRNSSGELVSFGTRYTSQKNFSKNYHFSFVNRLVYRRINRKPEKNSINIDSELCANLSIHLLKPRAKTNMFLYFWSSSPRCIFPLSSGGLGIITKTQTKLASAGNETKTKKHCEASWTNSHHVIINGSKYKNLTWIKLVVKT